MKKILAMTMVVVMVVMSAMTVTAATKKPTKNEVVKEIDKIYNDGNIGVKTRFESKENFYYVLFYGESQQAISSAINVIAYPNKYSKSVYKAADELIYSTEQNINTAQGCFDAAGYPEVIVVAAFSNTTNGDWNKLSNVVYTKDLGWKILD